MTKYTVNVPMPVVAFEIEADDEDEAIDSARDMLIEWAEQTDLSADIPL